MESIDLIGVDESFAPLSSSFSIDLINEKFYFNKNILTINRATFSVHSEFLNSFVVVDKSYSCIYLTINIRFDYVCEDSSINYELHTVHKLINVCNGDIKYDKKSTIYASIIDASVLNTNNNELDFYVLFGCCLC